jgi:hypothetical protein
VADTDADEGSEKQHARCRVISSLPSPVSPQDGGSSCKCEYSIGPTNSGHRQSAPKFRRLHPCNHQAVRFLLPSGTGPRRGRGPYWKNPSRN